MTKPVFTGVCTALVTPFLNGHVNYPMMEQLLKRQIDAGISAVVVCGTTGESPTLSDEEKLERMYRGYSDKKLRKIMEDKEYREDARRLAERILKERDEQ